MDAFDAARVRRDLAMVAGFDRYQASHGLTAATAGVASAARDTGLPQVTSRTAVADGSPAWWDWRSPQSWTPASVLLRVSQGGDDVVLIDRAEPFVLATHSAPRSVDGAAVVPLDRAAPGAVVVLPPGHALTPSVVADLERASVSAVLVSHARTGGARARVELPLGARLTVFSLTSQEHARVLGAAPGPGQVLARIVVEILDDAPMAWVDAKIPGELPGDVWVVAHLCHPAPSANDNAAGVAATLEVARHLVESLRGAAHHTVRFIWGPEYLASVATLHADTQRLGADGVPLSVVNVDMIGTDQGRDGGAFFVEGSRLGAAGLVDPLAVGALAEAFALTSAHPGRWEARPFLGFSDHALVAGPSPVAPAVQFAHDHDARTHSSADTEDSVSDLEVLRATAAVAATVEALSAPSLRPSAEVLHAEIRRWTNARTDAATASRRLGAEARDLHDLVDRRVVARRRLVHGRGPLNLRERIARAEPAIQREMDALGALHRKSLATLHDHVLRAEAGEAVDRSALDTGQSCAGATLPADVRRRISEIASCLASRPEERERGAHLTAQGGTRG